MKNHVSGIFLFLCGIALFAGLPAGAQPLLYDQEVTLGNVEPTPGNPSRLLFGVGVGNGGFTVDRRNGVELGLRAKLRFDANNLGHDVFNSNGDGTYTFPTGTPDLTKPRPSWATATTPIWVVTFSINTDPDDLDGTPSTVLGDLTYEMGIDFDPAGTNNWLRFDPISYTGPLAQIAVPDHYFGFYPHQGTGFTFTTGPDYVNALNTYNIVQNSQSMELFNEDLQIFGFGDYSGFDPNQTGIYTVYLAAFSGETEIARTEIHVLVGEEVSNVPSVLGLTQSAAETTLTAAGFTLGTVTQQFSTVAVGRVIGQEPAAGASAPAGQAVNIVVSKGEGPKVPVAGGAGIALLMALVGVVGAAGMRRKKHSG